MFGLAVQCHISLGRNKTPMLTMEEHDCGAGGHLHCSGRAHSAASTPSPATAAAPSQGLLPALYDITDFQPVAGNYYCSKQ